MLPAVEKTASRGSHFSLLARMVLQNKPRQLVQTLPYSLTGECTGVRTCGSSAQAWEAIPPLIVTVASSYQLQP